MTMKEPTLIDHVGEIILSLSDDERFKEYISVRGDYEGSLTADDCMASNMIREKAEEMGNLNVTSVPLAEITRALNHALRRMYVRDLAARFKPDEVGDLGVSAEQLVPILKAEIADLKARIAELEALIIKSNEN